MNHQVVHYARAAEKIESGDVVDLVLENGLIVARKARKHNPQTGETPVGTESMSKVEEMINEICQQNSELVCAKLLGAESGNAIMCRTLLKIKNSRPEDREEWGLEPAKDLIRAHIQIMLEKRINEFFVEMADMLIEKNRKYGNSALEPVRICSRASAREQILVRMDDKINRLLQGNVHDDEDVMRDLIGYRILGQVADRLNPPVEDKQEE